MTGAPRSVLAPFTGSDQSLSRSLSPVDRVPAESSPATRRLRLFSRAGSRSPICQRPSSPAAFGTVSCKKPFNTQRLVPAPFNEFYPNCSGPTIPLHHPILPPEHFR